MAKVKTFTNLLQIFQVSKELADLDAVVNKYIQENQIKRVISVSDAVTADNSGATIGIIRVLTYE